MKKLITFVLLLTIIFTASLDDKFKSVQEQTHSNTVIDGVDLRDALLAKRNDLIRLYDQAREHQYDDTQLEAIRMRIYESKKELQDLQEMWRELYRINGDTEAMWHLPDTTVMHLVAEFGAINHVYIIPKDIANIPLQVVSNLTIPIEEWDGMLKSVLQSQGVAIHEVNPYLRELRHSEGSTETIHWFVDETFDLSAIPVNERVCVVLNTTLLSRSFVYDYLVQSVSSQTATISSVGTMVTVTGFPNRVQSVISLYEMLRSQQEKTSFRAFNLTKLRAVELEAMLSRYFDPDAGNVVKGKRLSHKDYEFFVFDESQPFTLFVLADKEKLDHLSTVIDEIETQISTPSDKELVFYKCRHVTPDFLGEMVRDIMRLNNDATQHDVDHESFYVADKQNTAVIFSITQDSKSELMSIINDIDQPAKMVKIAFLMMEKKTFHEGEFGLNILNIGDSARNTDTMGGTFGRWAFNDTTGTNQNLYSRSISQFFFSQAKSTGESLLDNAFDLQYSYLITQDDIQVNANPTILTTNGTKARVNLVQESSISLSEEKLTDKTITNYTRHKYGITIEITPTIHDGEFGQRYVTLDTDITFDTTKDKGEKPVISKRSINNLVRIAEGQTVILGGLKQKDYDERKDSIPFLGEIPGIGKLFSYSKMSETNTEMFMFITPIIIDDPKDQLAIVDREELKRRPGDLPELQDALAASTKLHQKRLLQHSLETLFC